MCKFTTNLSLRSNFTNALFSQSDSEDEDFAPKKAAPKKTKTAPASKAAPKAAVKKPSPKVTAPKPAPPVEDVDSDGSEDNEEVHLYLYIVSPQFFTLKQSWAEQ